MAHATIDRNSVLPSFDNPPVEETAFSIQFAPIPKFGIPHFGLYWEHIRNEFGRFEVQPPISREIEQFETFARQKTRIGLQFVTEPDVRCWFLDESGNRLIQIQRDRFAYNWRRVTGEETYPRYPEARETIQTHWLRFLAFLESEDLGQPEVNQCEITYVNHIEIGSGWQNYAELNKVIAPWSGDRSGKFLRDPERANMEMRYLLPEKLGRLHVSIVPVIRARDTKEVLQMNLIARGAPKSSRVEDILDWFDLGREWVVKGFTDITTQSMHTIWRRTS